MVIFVFENVMGNEEETNIFTNKVLIPNTVGPLCTDNIRCLQNQSVIGGYRLKDID